MKSQIRKRDMDYIRTLMLEIEEGKTDFDTLTLEVAVALGMEKNDYLSKSDAAELELHLELLEDAGWVEFYKLNDGWRVKKLTSKGHDFLDSVRDPKIWQRTKSGAEAAGGFTVELLSELAKGFVKHQIKQKTGLDV